MWNYEGYGHRISKTGNIVVVNMSGTLTELTAYEIVDISDYCSLPEGCRPFETTICSVLFRNSAGHHAGYGMCNLCSNGKIELKPFVTTDYDVEYYFNCTFITK